LSLDIDRHGCPLDLILPRQGRPLARYRLR